MTLLKGKEKHDGNVYPDDSKSSPTQSGLVRAETRNLRFMKCRVSAVSTIVRGRHARAQQRAVSTLWQQATWHASLQWHIVHCLFTFTITLGQFLCNCSHSDSSLTSVRSGVAWCSSFLLGIFRVIVKLSMLKLTGKLLPVISFFVLSSVKFRIHACFI